MARAWLSLGSNIDARGNLDAALAELRSRFGEIAESPWYRTRAVGFEGPDFINLAAGLETDLEPVALRNWLRALEGRRGRDRSQPRFASRTLDVDLVLYDEGCTVASTRSQLPGADIAHAFVLRPLCDLAPDLVPSDGDPRSLAKRWRDLPVHDRESVAAIPSGNCGDAISA